MGAVLGAVFVFIAVVMLAGFFWGWILMLLMGVLHHEISESIPAIGFWPSVVIAVLLSVLAGMVRNSSSKR